MKQFFKYFKNVQHVVWYEGYLEKVPQQTMALKCAVILQMGGWTLSAYKIQLHGTEWIVSLSADWDQSPKTKNKKTMALNLLIAH